MADEKKSGEELVPGEAAETVVSLSQMLLAPLDAIFKAQVHAGRSFLNFVLQLSFGDKPKEAPGEPPRPPGHPDEIYTVDFVQKVPPVVPVQEAAPPRLQTVSVPAIALVPLRPMAIQEAEFDLAMEVTWIGPHRQTRQEVRDPATSGSGENRRWYLVDDPISLRGHVAPVPAAEGKGNQPHIKINVKLGPVPTPSGLDKLLTTLTQSASVADANPSKQQP